MASSPPLVIRPTDCCTSTCSDSQSGGGGQGPPGPQGPQGPQGNPGNNGVNAFTTTTSNFTMPAPLGNVTVQVADSDWMGITQMVYVSSAGYFFVNSKPDSTHAVLTNGNVTGNVAPGTNVGSGQTISPGGRQGAPGIPGPAGGFVLQDFGAPVAAPPSPTHPALYTDLNTGVIYTWNVVTQAWI